MFIAARPRVGTAFWVPVPFQEQDRARNSYSFVHAFAAGSIKPGCGGVAVGADVLRNRRGRRFQVGQQFRLGDAIQSIARLAEDGGDLDLALAE
jgi:hypothetical protein